MTITLHNQRFGTELEYFGITRYETAELLEEKMEWSRNGSYGLVDSKGRTWYVSEDGSVDEEGCELVTPILTFEDIPTLYKVVSILNENGGEVNESCGNHVHIDGANHNVNSLKNMALFYRAHEAEIYKAFDVYDYRAEGYAKTVDRVEHRLENKMRYIKEAKHIDEFHRSLGEWRYEKYVGLNFGSFWNRGTIEFRLFNGSVNPDQVISHVTFALAVSAKSINTNPLEMNFEPMDIKAIFDYLGITGDNPDTSTLYNRIIRTA